MMNIYYDSILLPSRSFRPRGITRSRADCKNPHHTFHVTHSSDTEPPAKFSRLTHSTFYRFITGHAFTGEYTQRFFPQHTPEQIACQCGEPLQTIEHVLFHCTLFTAAPQTPHSQRPPSKLSTAARKPEARTSAASVPRGDKGLQ